MFFSEVATIPFEKIQSYTLVDIITNPENDFVNIYLKGDASIEKSKKFALITFPIGDYSPDKIECDYSENRIVFPIPEIDDEDEESIALPTPHYSILDDCVRIREKKIPYIRNWDDVELKLTKRYKRKVGSEHLDIPPFDTEKFYNNDLYQLEQEFLFIFNFEGRYNTIIRETGDLMTGEYNIWGFNVKKITLSIINLITGHYEMGIYEYILTREWILRKNFKFDITFNRKDGYIEIDDLSILIDINISQEAISTDWVSSDRKFMIKTDTDYFVLGKIDFIGERGSASSKEEEKKDVSTQTESNIPINIIEKLEQYYFDKSN